MKILTSGISVVTQCISFNSILYLIRFASSWYDFLHGKNINLVVFSVMFNVLRVLWKTHVWNENMCYETFIQYQKMFVFKFSSIPVFLFVVILWFWFAVNNKNFITEYQLSKWINKLYLFSVYYSQCYKVLNFNHLLIITI